jgi:cobalamin biosynthesis protein CobT
VANELMINLNEALQGIKGLNYSIAGYSTGDQVTGKIQGVCEDANLYVVKEFGKKFNEKAMCLAIGGGINHNNNDYESVKWAYRELQGQPNSRKIMFVIADGYPACYGVDGDVLDRLTKEAIQFCWKKDIEVYGFGIGHDLSKIFDHFTMVDTDNLNIDIANNLRKLITRSVV